MRISDWSSDVFSSDLEAAAGLDHAVAQVAGLGVDALRAQYFAHVVGDLVARATVDRGFEAALGDALFDAVAHAGELGRASCRERVCPYVWIKVVAESLKTKKKPRSPELTAPTSQ